MTPRILPYEAPFAPAVEEQLRRMMQTSKVEPIALFRTMARNLPMTAACWRLGHYGLGDELTLSRREREILIDRASARLGCEYEWGVHVAFFGSRVGFTREQLTSLTHGDSHDPCWTDERERLVIAAVDELVDHHDLSDDLWQRLADRFTTEELLDLLCMTGWYHAICFLARATRLPLETYAPAFADYR